MRRNGIGRASLCHAVGRDGGHRRFRLAGAALLLGVGTVALAGAPAAAQGFFSRLFGSGEAAEPVPDAKPYTLDFIVADETLREAMEAASNLKREEARPPSGTAGLLARARGDYGRLLAALYREARYGGSVRILIDGRDPASIAPDAPLPEPVPVSVTIDPGPLFRFGQVAIEGLPPAAGDAEREAVRAFGELEIGAGDAARSSTILAAEGKLVAIWRQRGHPKARIAERQVVADHRSRTVDVTIAVAPGPQAAFGAVAATGAERTDPDFVVRQTGIRPGDPYDPDTLERAKERLRRLEVFSSVAVEEAEFLDAAGGLPVTFRLAERKPRVVGGGASFSTVDGAGVEAYWAHRNLFGRAERLRLEAEASRIGADGPQDINYAVGATFVKPGVLTPDTDVTLFAGARREFVDAYERRSILARIGLAHRFSEALSGEIGVAAERSRVEDVFGRRDHMILSLPSQLAYDSRDDKLDPTEGVNARLGLEPFHDLRGGATAVAATVSAATYRAFGEDDRFVLAGRVAAGSVAGAALAEVPADRRFFLGGGGSIRGYAYRNVGPRRDGEVVGGLSFWETSLELRARLTERFGLVPFVDFGAAYEEAVPDFSEGVRVGAGLGIRYHTPLGPLRLDVAKALDPGRGDPGFAVYLGLGQAF